MFMSQNGSDVTTYKMECPNCGAEITVEALMNPGFSDHENVFCPKCNIDLGEIKADLGFKIVAVKE